MESKPTSFNELVGANRTFRIPRYQRNYSWEEHQLEDLWRDLETIIGTDKPHFMGTVLLRKNSDSGAQSQLGVTVYDIIDGQQRLTTLLILLHLISEEHRQANSEAADSIRGAYIEGHYGFKLSLNNEDGQYFKEEILEGREGTKPPSRSTKTNSEERLKHAKEFFSDRLKEKREDTPEDFTDYSDYLDKLTNAIASLEFKSYDVSSESEAVRIFEATNDRGKGLTNLERTKSFLMYQLHLCYPEDEEGKLERDLENIRNVFKNMYSDHQAANEGMGSTPSLSRIQRYHFIIWDNSDIRVRNPAYQNFLRELKDHFREMDPGQKKANAVLNYAYDLRGAFEAVEKIHTGNLGGEKSNIRLKRLFALNVVGNFYPILIATWLTESVDDESQLADLLDRIETYTFRGYILMDYRTNKRKNGFYVLGREIHSGNKSIHDAIEKIEKYITWDCDDTQLDGKLRDDRFYKSYGSKRIRYLLYFYDVHLSDSGAHLHLKFDEVVEGESEDYKITIEHIWPQNANRLELTSEEEASYDDYKHRLGNLALMKHKENSSESNKPFHKKLDRYLQNEILMLNRVAKPEARAKWGDEQWKPDEWGIDQIEAREEVMRTFIQKRWPDYTVTEA